MKRLSIYTNLLETNGRHFLFNIANDTVLALNPQLYFLIEEHRNSIDHIKDIHPQLFECLTKSNLIVEQCNDESSELIKEFEKSENDMSSFGIIVNPTLDCNLRCWYCYESHLGGSMMTPETIASIKRLIDSKVSNQSLKRLSLSFFGGEPLLGWDKVVLPLLKYATNECHDRSINFKTAFTTNGVLLSERVFDGLSHLGLGSTSFQISFDGSRIFHDSSRIGAAKRPTYDIIMRNVALGASKGFTMNLRFNYTPETVDSFVDILGDLNLLPDNSKEHILCNFQQVWQTMGKDDETREKVSKLVEIFKDSGFTASCDTIYHRHVCYADCPNSIVVNYNGDLYKCTAREFDPATREGVLTEDGSVIWNERFSKRMEIKYANIACRKCKIMPICNGGCSQNKLDRDDFLTCPYARSEAEKQDMVMGAFYERISKRQTTPCNLKSPREKN